MILKLLITFHKIYCLPFLNTFHEKKMSMPPLPPQPIHFFTQYFLRGTGRGRGDKYFMNKKT